MAQEQKRRGRERGGGGGRARAASLTGPSFILFFQYPTPPWHAGEMDSEVGLADS